MCTSDDFFRDIACKNIITSALFTEFSFIDFYVVTHKIKLGFFEFQNDRRAIIWKKKFSSVCYRAISFNISNREKIDVIYAESYLNLTQKTNYLLAKELETANEPLGKFLLNRWSEEQLKFTDISTEKISGKDLPKLFNAEADKPFLFRKRIITAEEHQFLIHEYFPMS